MIRAAAFVLVVSASFGATTFLIAESWAWPLVVSQALAWALGGYLLGTAAR